MLRLRRGYHPDSKADKVLGVVGVILLLLLLTLFSKACIYGWESGL